MPHGIVNFADNVNIAGNLDVTGDVTIGGNITIGDAPSDSISIIAGIPSNLVPEGDGVYDSGIPSNRWRKAYLGEAQIDDVNINTNVIPNYKYNPRFRITCKWHR